VINIICTVLYSEGLNVITNNITSQLFTYIICSIYLIITPVILCSYVMEHRMPELIVSFPKRFYSLIRQCHYNTQN
jgi:hypothetical protein